MSNEIRVTKMLSRKSSLPLHFVEISVAYRVLFLFQEKGKQCKLKICEEFTLLKKKQNRIENPVQRPLLDLRHANAIRIAKLVLLIKMGTK